MIYKLLFNSENKSFVTAKCTGCEWQYSELRAPFEIVPTGELEPETIDRSLKIKTSWGVVGVNLSDIDRSLVTEDIARFLDGR